MIRELVLGILIEVFEEGGYSNVVIHKTLMKYQYLEKKERSFLTRLSEGIIERVIELDYVIDVYSKIKTKKMKSVIRNLLRMGVYQILYMDQVPDSAACNETVKLAKKKGFQNLKGFVNGVLRSISREKEKIPYPEKETDLVEYLKVMYSTPEWMIHLWLKEYSEDVVERILKAFLRKKKTTIRCNTTKVSKSKLIQILKEEGVSVEEGTYLSEALYIYDYDYLGGLSSFQNGLFQVQDESSMLISQIAGLKEKDVVLDVCAAPGGKSTHAGEILHPLGTVIARDLTPNKIELIEENVKRLGLKNIRTEYFNALERDEDMIHKADVVFADLPCSGIGVMHKKGDIKYKTNPQDMMELGKLQQKILRVVSDYVKPGGVLIYSTCTISPWENLKNSLWFQDNFDFELENFNEFLPEQLKCQTAEEGYLQLLPGIQNTDGFFMAKFRRRIKKERNKS